MAQEGSVFAIGNPLLDITASVDDEYLKKYNLKRANAILAGEEHASLYSEMVEKFDVEYSAGGAAQNTARALSWMLGAKNVPVYVGCIGDDAFGEKLRESASAEGVAVNYLVDPETPTGTCAALIVEKDRTLVANLAAANKYQKSHFDSEDIQSKLNAAKFIYSAGFFLTVSTETLVDLGKHAAANDKPFMFNLSAPFLIDFFTDQMKSVLPYADIVIGNETEGLAFAKKFFDTEDLKEALMKLGKYEKVNDKRERIAIFTQGPNPVLVYYKGEVLEFPIVALDPSVIVDSNGAGDSFCGGFLAALVLGKELNECVAAGSYCGGVILQVGGVVYNGKSTFTF